MKKYRYWLYPLIFIILIAPWTPKLDMAISSFFFHNGHFSTNSIIQFIYVYGLLPAWISTCIGMIIIIISIWSKHMKAYRKAAWILVLSLALGAGLIANVILKDHWGRPRPTQIEEFGGTMSFRPFYMPNFSISTLKESKKSFPSGHATMGFYFLSLYFVGKRYDNKLIYFLGILLTVSLGTALGITRLAQGGHFFSDIIATAAIMWYTALILDTIIHKNKWKAHERTN